jgi:uncharacterized protein
LLLRGPQTAAELRTRSDRLHAFGSTGEVEDVLRSMERRDPPLVQHHAPLGGEREGRWGQLVAEEAVPLEARSTAASPAPARSDRIAELEARVESLEARLAKLETLLE